MDDEAKTPADRLERALREHEARKKAAAELGAQQAPELERLKALHTRLEALPQNERRAVSDAAGMRQVSAAPRPLEPLRGAGYVPRLSPKAVRWPAWLALPHVELWQAVALSLGLNPADELRGEVSRAPSRFSRLPAEFFERLSHCKKALSFDGPIRPQGSPYQGMRQSPACPVLMADVAAFLTLAGFELPEEVRPRPPAEPEVNRGALIKREALVLKHERTWPTIDRDLKDASENGLSAAAKSDKRGMWWEAAALAWATAKGKLRGAGPGAPASPFSGLGR
jgi:hypothetical protein